MMRRHAPVVALAAAATLVAVAGLAVLAFRSDGSSPSPPPTVTLSPPTATPTSTATTPSASPLACPSAEPPPADAPGPDIIGDGYRLTPVLPDANWGDMLDFALIPGLDNAAVIARQNGEIWKVSLDGSFGPTLFGNLDPIVESGGEQGLLSLAFSPDFQSDGRVYVYYTRGSPNPSVLSRFQASAACMDTAGETVIIEVPQPYANHNGGSVRFGKDGYLYLSLGDGGSGGDPQGNAQNTDSLLGKVLRLDVTGQETYAIPPDNPFANGGGRAEVYAYGLRNPWRMSMDLLTGDIWLGDVGQNSWEEVDRITLGGNYGWRCYEGFEPYNPAGCSSDSGKYIFPRTAYPTGANGNRAVTGGYVYRGTAMPELYGRFIYADTYSGRIWAVNTTDESEPVELMDTGELIYSFAELKDGELLVLTADGIYRLATAS